MNAKNSLYAIAMCLLLTIGGALNSHAYEPLPAKMDGTMMPYDFRHGDSVTPWQWTEMEPVAVAYVARHGARYLSSEKKVESLRKAVVKARKGGTLSADGEAFAALIDTVCAVSAGRWGDLSPVGEAEEQRLGEQLCELLGPLASHITGKGESTYVPRVVKTMWDFLYPVAARSKENSITTAEGRQFSPLLRFFDTDSVYAAYIKEGDWKEAYKKFVEKSVSPEPARRLFGKIGSDSELRELTLDMYGMLQGLRASGLPGPTTQWMTATEYRACWAAGNLKRYLTRSLTPLTSEAMRASAPLLRTIIRRTDAALDSIAGGHAGAVNANFWFGHAETLLPLTALMGLPGCVTMPRDWTELTDVWRDYNITPLGANILIVLLRNPDSQEIHAALRLNGIWVAPVGGEGLTPTWDSVRSHWEQRIGYYGGESSEKNGNGDNKI